MAVFGGMMKLILSSFTLFVQVLNQEVIKAKLIRSLYFIKKPKNRIPKFHIHLGT